MGGGLAGVSLLYDLALTSNLNVVLLEQDTIGAHASGRHTGHITTGDFSTLLSIRREHGDEIAKAYWAFARRANESLKTLIRHHNLDCSLQEKGGFHTGSAATDIADQRSAYSFLINNEVEDSYEVLNTMETNALLNTKLFKGGIYVPEEAVCDRFQLVSELAETCEQAGRHIIENALVDRVTRTPHGMKVHVRHRGTILARHVVYCIGAYTPEILPSVEPYMHRWREHAIGTKQFTDRIANDIMPSIPVRHRDKSLWVHDNRLLIGGVRSEVDAPDDGEYDQGTFDRMRHFVNSVYPGLLKQHPPEYVWSSVHASTVDGLPLIGPIPRRSNEWVCTGFGGHNLGFQVECGKVISEFIQHGACNRIESDLFSPYRYCETGEEDQ